MQHCNGLCNDLLVLLHHRRLDFVLRVLLLSALCAKKLHKQICHLFLLLQCCLEGSVGIAFQCHFCEQQNTWCQQLILQSTQLAPQAFVKLIQLLPCPENGALWVALSEMSTNCSVHLLENLFLLKFLLLQGFDKYFYFNWFVSHFRSLHSMPEMEPHLCSCGNNTKTKVTESA